VGRPAGRTGHPGRRRRSSPRRHRGVTALGFTRVQAALVHPRYSASGRGERQARRGDLTTETEERLALRAELIERRPDSFALYLRLTARLREAGDAARQ
jgi:hypothetical protein